MASLRRRALSTAGVAVGLLTLQAWRKRRSQGKEDESMEMEHGTAESPREHAAAAAEHARAAAEKTVEERRKQKAK
jgi:hypothetical protein